MTMAAKPRLVASDIGGTLASRSAERIPIDTTRVLDRLMEEKIPVVLATGYNLRTTTRLIRNLKHTPWLLVQNGTACVRGKEVLWEHGLEAGTARVLVRALEERKFPAIVYRDISRGCVPEYRGFGLFEPKSPFRAVLSFDHFDGVTGVSSRIPNHMAGEVHALLDPLVPRNCQLIRSVGKRFSWIEVTPGEARKDLALTRLCGMWNISLADVIYFGDNLNDLEVLSRVGHPRVVADGMDELRSRFPVVPACNQNGPARELERIYFSAGPSQSG